MRTIGETAKATASYGGGYTQPARRKPRSKRRRRRRRMKRTEQETEEKEAEEAEKRRWLVRGIFIKVNARRSPWQRNWIFFSKFFRPFSPAPIPEGGERGDGGSTEEMAVAAAAAAAAAAVAEQAEGKW